MDNYVTGAVIKQLRDLRGLTQQQLAERLCISDKTVSKWETAKGMPDISLLEPLAEVLGVSLTELFSGNIIKNKNVSANMLRAKCYVCPVCGNVIVSRGEAVVSCCGINLPALESEPCDEEHTVELEEVEDEYFVSFSHSMSKAHYISFIALLRGDKLELVKLYPEGNAEARFRRCGHGILLFYCNKHGLFSKRI